ncbi:MAG TPA: ATP-binding protein [Bryobacteraceae bacterium]|nr:ATP-binding protein [Bryobacteraceae bacterium]
MRKRIMFGSLVLLLSILMSLVISQGSFNLGAFAPAPSTIQETYLFWAVSTVIFILTVTLGFMLFRTVVKLYIERQTNRPGSHIKSKLIGGALALSVLPIFFLVLWSVSVLNLNLDKWFSRPAQTMDIDLKQIARAFNREVEDKLTAQAHWLATQPAQSADFYERFCQQNQIETAEVQSPDGSRRMLCSVSPSSGGELYKAGIRTEEGTLVVTARMPLDLAAKQREINQAVAEYDRLSVDKKAFRRLYLLLLSLITLFILFFAIWIARYMAGQISTPITALLRAAEQIRKGNLGVRVRVDAIDEMATLVRAFNEMTEAQETNSKELEDRRRFTEAILESIPTGVISLSSDGRIQRVNRALLGIFPEDQVARAARLSDLFSREDTAEIRYLMNSARRKRVAGTQIEYKAERRVLQLSLTVAALDELRSSGFVLVVEDTSELLRAQKASAWHEVARRVAHEIKNPLTPIALCADRIARQLGRAEQTADTRRILHECSATIAREVETVRTLVDEFSQFSRFPAAQPVLSDLNQIVEKAIGVFEGRLGGIQVDLDLTPGLPSVLVDAEQFKRVIVNLVDNAAEAMQDSLLKRLYIGTRSNEADFVELVIADTGCGVSREDKEKLFLPYFSTKGRGTGLGLAIVNRILSDHDASIRVEDNSPTGARFIVELPIPAVTEPDAKPEAKPAVKSEEALPAESRS